MAIKPLLERHFLQEVVDVDLLRLLDEPVDLDAPRPRLQSFGGGGDALARAEFIEIVIVGVDLFRRDVAVELERLVAFRREKPRRRIGFGACARKTERAGDEAATERRRSAEHRPAIEE